MPSKTAALIVCLATTIIANLLACSPAAPTTVEVTRVVTEQVEVPVTRVITRQVEINRPVEDNTPTPSKETIIFSDLNWESVVLQNRIAQYIVEKGYGYPTDAQFGTMVPMFQGLREGDNHVTRKKCGTRLSKKAKWLQSEKAWGRTGSPHS